MSAEGSDDWPSHNAELSRKTSAQIDKWSRAFAADSITKREFYITVSALYDATSGLIDKDISDLMVNIHAELRQPS